MIRRYVFKGKEDLQGLLKCHTVCYLEFRHPCLIRSCHPLLLQLGYDPARKEYPDWLASQPFAGMLPRVVAPGSVVGGVTKVIAERHGKTTFALV